MLQQLEPSLSPKLERFSKIEDVNKVSVDQKIRRDLYIKHVNIYSNSFKSI